MVRKSLGVALSVVLTIFMVFGSVVSPLSGVFDVFAAENGKWIYVDGQNGNDGNDGSSAGSAVKSWDKAKELLGCKEGGIYVVGTVEANGTIDTKQPGKQVVKRTSDIVMFHVAGGSKAEFININVDGEDKEFDSEVIHPDNGATINFFEGAKFQRIGYLEDVEGNREDNVTGDPDGLKKAYSTKGGRVCSLQENVVININGAEFINNKGKGVFWTPWTGAYGGGFPNVTLTMWKGSVTGNWGHFYFNENATTSNKVQIYNALVTGNDTTYSSQRYDRPIATSAVHVCNEGQIIVRTTDGAAIFGNSKHDIEQESDGWDPGAKLQIRGKNAGEKPGKDYNKMLGGGNPNWSELIEWDDPNTPFAPDIEAYEAHPSAEDIAKARNAAESIFENNKSVVFDSNGMIQFGRYENEQKATPPEKPSVDQTCDDTPTPTAKPKVTNTTAKANGTAASEQNAAEVTITKGDAVAITDDVAFEGLAENVTYTVKSELWSNGSVQQTKTTEVTSATASPITVSFDNVSPEAQQQFNIRTVLLKDGQEVAVHNDGRNTVSERVIVKVEEPAVVYTPAIKNTTAKAKQGNGEEVSASEGAAANVTVAADEALNLTISDVIELEGLNPEKEYTLKTYLWYNGQKQLTKETTVSGDVTSLTVSFDDAVTTEASETGYNISNELYDGNEKVAEHNGSRNIVSERVTVTREEPEEPTEPETPTEPENPTPDEPTEPENPTPEEPTEPETPTEPENPTPNEPTEPETPTEPENPTPEQPTEPENPTPEEPAQEEPTTPAEEKVSVKISKTDMAGTEIEGAEIVIKDADGNEILCWTSDKTVKSFEVAPGTYTLEETNAPEGYQRVETKIEFEVAADGTVTVKTTAVDPAGACEVIDGVLVLKDEVKEKVNPADNTNGTSSGSKTKSANTGDSNELVLYLGMVMMAGVAATALIIRRRKAEK